MHDETPIDLTRLAVRVSAEKISPPEFLQSAIRQKFSEILGINQEKKAETSNEKHEVHKVELQSGG